MISRINVFVQIYLIISLSNSLAWLLQFPPSVRLLSTSLRFVTSFNGQQRVDSIHSSKRNEYQFLQNPPIIHLISSQNQTIAKNYEWESFYTLYRDEYFIQNSSSLDIPAGPALHQSPLRNWCAQQRKSFMKTLGLLDMSEPVNWGIDEMTLLRKQRLDSVGFYWGENIIPKNTTDAVIFSEEFRDHVWKKYKDDLVWNPYYNRLVQFYRKHGHTNVEQINLERVRIEETLDGDESLEMWVMQQRLVQKDMSDKRRNKLDALGFVWNVSEHIHTIRAPHASSMEVVDSQPKSVSWSQRIKQLLFYKDKYGDLNIPKDYDEIQGLGKWVHRQRRNKRLSLKSQLQLRNLGLLG